ncbi:MAG TPA: VacJ family lipoprotein [Paenalcaligenes sp.]|nr:VacJ family lipoprotein [Paenalcaligenes sp.]
MSLRFSKNNPRIKKTMRFCLAAAALALSAGCATVKNPNPDDPFESYNRTMDKINYNVDHALVLPVTNMYKALTPQPAQTCVSNIFNNLGDLWSAVNSFFQGRPHDFFNSLGRVLFNTTMGLGGCIDVASMNDAKPIPNDLGTTLGVWGVPSGPYLVIPGLGPSTVRDGVARVGGFATGFSPTYPIMEIDRVRVRNSILGLYLVDMRAGLTDAEDLVDDLALDRYSFIRDAYLQRRKALLRSKKAPVGSDAHEDLPTYENIYEEAADDLPTYDDPDDDLPQYEDPDDDLPVYEDPEDNTQDNDDPETK